MSGKMKFQYKARVSVDYYRDLHKNTNCTGRFEPVMVKDSFLTIESLGPVRLQVIPMMVCHTCEAGFIAPKFKQSVEGIIARHLVTTNAALSKSQIRFLRQFLGMTQQAFAKFIGVSDKQEMLKFESEKYVSKHLDADRQLRLKIKCAQRLNVRDTSFVYNIVDSAETAAVIEPSIFSQLEEKYLRLKQK
jgi:DNA-binding transcriptional regulator YiaG